MDERNEPGWWKALRRLGVTFVVLVALALISDLVMLQTTDGGLDLGFLRSSELQQASVDVGGKLGPPITAYTTR